MTPDEMRLYLMDKGATKPAIPKHERKANLDKFLEGSKAPKMYHATGDDFKSFAPEKTHLESKLGKGFYMTPNTNKANYFANIRTKQGKNAQIMPVHSSIKNPYEIQGAQNIPFNRIDTKKLKDLGYDGIFYRNEDGELQEAVAFEPNQVKSAIGNRGTYDPKEDDMSKADGGAINAEPLGEDTVKWTSPLADTVNSHKLGSMSGEQWMSWLHANAPKNAKKEAHASGTFDWLPQQANASKEAIVKHMKANAPRIKVKKFSNNPYPKEQARYDELHNDGEVRRLTSDERDEMNELEQKLVAGAPTRFDEYQLPRGENYREMTLSHSNHTGDDYIAPAGHGYQDNDADINRILHMRMNDMPYAFNDKKALNIEELQSDWAQRGRSHGFKKPDASVTKLAGHKWDKGIQDTFGINENAPAWGVHDAQGKRLGTHWDESTAHQFARSLNPKSKGLPSGPYVQNTEDWTRLGLHNAIKEAAEKGHHAVTWTNGDEQAKRWNEEGLKHYYDTVMPSVANDILKRMGVKERVGMHFLGKHTTGIKTHHGFHMTPEIVAHIKKHGLPRFASGGDISKLKAYMLKKQGTHGARRVERAADEVPNLESMYSPEALEWALGKYNPQTALGVIKPSDFEKYATPLPSSSRNTSGRATPTADMSKYNTDTDEYVKYLQSIRGFSEVPMLQFDKSEVGLPIMPSIKGHEGRHRNRALANRGEQSSLVVMAPHTNLRSKLPNKGFADTHEQFLKSLHKEMAKTDNMVTPQTYTIPKDNDKSIFEQERRIIRPNIRLPEMFASGGRSVEALDRESDEVPIEKRVRDALDKIHLNASGGKDAYGTGAGGRLAVDFPLSKSVTLSPYLEGSAYKPKDQNTSSQISGAGLSLTKRFAEGGKAKFLEPSAEKDRWYHGSHRNIRSFKSINRHGHLGKPDRPNIHFVSKSPDVANQFAMRGHQHPQFGEPIELNDKDYMEGMDHRSGANVMPVHIQVNNPFDIADPKHFKAINKHLTERYADYPEGMKEYMDKIRSAHKNAKLNEDNYQPLEHHNIQEAIKDMGHDSFYTNELGTRNLGIYDPRKIKSAIGNRGTYDTNEHDITKSKGGLAHAFAEGGPVDIPKNILDLHAKDQQLFLDNAVNGHANRHLKLRYTNSWKRLNKAIKAHIGDDPKEVLEYHWKLQDHYNKEHGE